ncbi:carbamoyltransferase C-terminal domain-containing protein [Robbsia sp. KACC 23696]|uniref:carbamoyltransferase C-terminal domain-containing protein n=1 Tax=Robbsia sp. KACC 23696 TaxID=3149231 RepID=UPI00325B6F8B
MKIFALKPGHDGHVAYVENGHLEFSIEAEKDSGLRFAVVDGLGFFEAMQRLKEPPDVFALSGWTSGAEHVGRRIGSGYMGIDNVEKGRCSMTGSEIRYFSSSHERSHIMCSYALSPFAQGVPCYALIWEGHIGAFYEIDAAVRIRRLSQIMAGPGIRYAYAYAICDPTFDLPDGHVRLSDAGKLMALAAYEKDIKPTSEEELIIKRLMADPGKIPELKKDNFSEFSAFNCGVESVAAKRLARLISDALWLFFKSKILSLVDGKRPLLIGGGCGLNCDWNRAFLDCGLFSDVFVPPCTNDSGSAIGTAADAQLTFTGEAKLTWNVYCGLPFLNESSATQKNIGEFSYISSDPLHAARYLKSGAVLAWVAGKTEVGPRALGNRSILAEPYLAETTRRLNTIKNRESFRPIAPICLEMDVGIHFDIARASPHMLYFARVHNDALRAITHVDGSSRVQTVSRKQNQLLHDLLCAFKKEAGVGVLCNTSLNFNGKGFINRTSDLLAYAQEVNLDGFAIEGAMYVRDPARAQHWI